MTPEGSTHVDTFTGTTSSFSRTASRKVAVVGCGPPTGLSARPELQVQRPVALDHHVGILQQMLPVDAAEVALAPTRTPPAPRPSPPRPRGRPPNILAATSRVHRDGSLPGEFLGLADRRRHVVDEMVRRLGVPALQAWAGGIPPPRGRPRAAYLPSRSPGRTDCGPSRSCRSTPASAEHSPPRRQGGP